MLFVSSEKSKRTQVIKLFKTIYDSSPKEYPNGSTMVFILLTEGTHTSPAYWKKKSCSIMITTMEKKSQYVLEV